MILKPTNLILSVAGELAKNKITGSNSKVKYDFHGFLISPKHISIVKNSKLMKVRAFVSRKTVHGFSFIHQFIDLK